MKTPLLIRLLLLVAAGTVAGCSDEPSASLPPLEDLNRDIQHMALQVDLSTQQATATIDLAPSASLGASFEAKGLTISEVRDGQGTPLQFAKSEEGQLDVGVPSSQKAVRLSITYTFKQAAQFQGWMKSGATLTWPYYCGNLFPCHASPADGLTFELKVDGTPSGKTTLVPPPVKTEAPSYMLAWATGEYTSLDLGTTKNGTHLAAYYQSGGASGAQQGTASLLAIFQWYEDTYGPYPFGTEAGTISVTWGAGAYGGMEHHPLWHVADIAFADPVIHAHEAAHGWFGDGVRIACWEDFVLSEGTASYLEARSVAAVMGDTEGQKVWTSYQTRLNGAMSGKDMKIAWPDGCGTIDILQDRLFSDIPYVKGAFFFRALENKIGVVALDSALRTFVAAHMGKAAHFGDLLDTIQAESGYDPTACAQSWLKVEAVPAPPDCP
jgi:aminopeptidase N